MPHSINFTRLAVTNNDRCSICDEDINKDAVGHITKEKIKHTFHLPCIVRWFEESRRCPLCRVKVDHIDPGLFTRLKPYILGGTVAATTAVAVGAAVMPIPNQSSGP